MLSFWVVYIATAYFIEGNVKSKIVLVTLQYILRMMIPYSVLTLRHVVKSGSMSGIKTVKVHIEATSCSMASDY